MSKKAWNLLTKAEKIDTLKCECLQRMAFKDAKRQLTIATAWLLNEKEELGALIQKCDDAAKDYHKQDDLLALGVCWGMQGLANETLSHVESCLEAMEEL